MKTSVAVTFFCLVMLVIQAQSFTTQVLNREPFKSAVSLTQDYDGDGDLDIIVSRWEPAGIYVLENDSTKQFPPTPIITENLTFYIADIDAADFDNDSDIDYLVCFTGVTDGELAWFQRQADGTYQKWTIVTNKDFIMADVGDFDGDGWMDITAVGLGNSDKEGRVYMNQKNLFFTEKIVAINGISGSVDAGDIDGDGDLDIAFGGSGIFNNPTTEDGGARIMINDSKGNFSLGGFLNSYTNSHAGIGYNIQIVDLNGDGKTEVLGIRSFASLELMYFSKANNYKGIIIPENQNLQVWGDFMIFDINNDGRLDIVVQDFDTVYALYQNQNFNFTVKSIELNWNNCCNPTAKMSVGDLDNDGDLDLVFPEQGNVDYDISWFENIGGELYKHQITGELDGVRIPKLVDFDYDGDLDILTTVSSGTINTTEDELILFENKDGKNFINWRLNDALDYAADVEIADIDGDGDMDAFATARDADDLVWLRNDGFQANWVTDTIFAEGNQPLGIATDDLDDDGDADVVMCSWNDDKIFAFLNDGSGHFAIKVVDAQINGPKEVEIADLDKDGDKDIVVVATESENSVVTYLNNGSETFTEKIIYTGAEASDLEVVDWNGDGFADIFASFNETNEKIIGFIRTDTGYYHEKIQLPNDYVLSLKVVDIDKDGDYDIISGHDEGNLTHNKLYINLFENGMLQKSIPLGDNKGGDITGIDVGDVNNDGILDMVYADFSQDDLVLLTIGCLVAPTPSITKIDATCGQNNGSATIDIIDFNTPSITWSNGSLGKTISDLAPGNYKVTIIDSNGCSTSSSISIINTPIASTELTKSNTSCGKQDGTVGVKVLSGHIISYQWNNGATSESISNLAGGTYSVTATDENNCQIIHSTVIEGLTNPIVDLGDDFTLNTGESVTLDVTCSGCSYLWSTGGKTATITVNSAGSYAVTVTNEQGCNGSDTIIVKIISANNDLPLKESINIFPNPTDEFINVIFNEQVNISSFEIFDATNKSVYKNSIGSQKNIVIKTDTWTSGIYFLKIITKKGILFKKIIKE